MKKPIFLFLILLFGCSQRSTEISGDVLTKKEMAMVMTEIHILEGRIYKLYLKEDSARQVYAHYERLLLDSLDIPQNKFERSVEYYLDETKTFRKIYEEVVDTLLSRQKTGQQP